MMNVMGLLSNGSEGFKRDDVLRGIFGRDVHISKEI